MEFTTKNLMEVQKRIKSCRQEATKTKAVQTRLMSAMSQMNIAKNNTQRLFSAQQQVKNMDIVTQLAEVDKRRYLDQRTERIVNLKHEQIFTAPAQQQQRYTAKKQTFQLDQAERMYHKQHQQWLYKCQQINAHNMKVIQKHEEQNRLQTAYRAQEHKQIRGKLFQLQNLVTLKEHELYEKEQQNKELQRQEELRKEIERCNIKKSLEIIKQVELKQGYK